MACNLLAIIGAVIVSAGGVAAFIGLVVLGVQALLALFRALHLIAPKVDRIRS